MVSIETSIRWHKVTVGAMLDMVRVNKLLQEQDVRIDFIVEPLGELLASGNFGATPGGLFKIPAKDGELLESFTADLQLPMPLFLSPSELKSLEGLDTPARNAFWREKGEKPVSDKPVVTALILEMANVLDEVVDEEFLSFFPGVAFKAPGVADEEKQALLDEIWRKGDLDVRLTAYFQEDIFTLAENLRNWVANPQVEFPFRFKADRPTTPGVRSYLQLIYEPEIDCVWHRLRPVRFRFRPVNRGEGYQLEASYWESSGDMGRAELAREIMAREKLADEDKKTTPKIFPAPETGSETTGPSEATDRSISAG